MLLRRIGSTSGLALALALATTTPTRAAATEAEEPPCIEDREAGTTTCRTEILGLLRKAYLDEAARGAAARAGLADCQAERARDHAEHQADLQAAIAAALAPSSSGISASSARWAFGLGAVGTGMAVGGAVLLFEGEQGAGLALLGGGLLLDAAGLWAVW